MENLLGQEGHPGGGLLQSPPMPKKPNISQVGTGIVWSSLRA